jgi:hypothetical protein
VPHNTGEADDALEDEAEDEQGEDFREESNLEQAEEPAEAEVGAPRPRKRARLIQGPPTVPRRASPKPKVAPPVDAPLPRRRVRATTSLPAQEPMAPKTHRRARETPVAQPDWAVLLPKLMEATIAAF